MKIVSMTCLTVGLALTGVAVAGGDHGLRFNTAGVLDLAEATQPATSGKAVPVSALAAAEAGKIAAASTQSEEQPVLKFSDDEFGCKAPSKKCSQDHERALLSAQLGAVKRTASALIVTPSVGTAARFVDWKQGSKSSDGDAATHVYVGKLAGSGYQRVEVQFGQDSPGSFLVNPQTGKVAFVHNGSDVVVPSPDGMRLATFNALNGPLSIRVAALDATGPRVALHCHAADGPTAAFKGWHDATSFDLVVGKRGGGNQLEKPVMVRVGADAGGWRVVASDPAQLAAYAFSCRAE